MPYIDSFEQELAKVPQTGFGLITELTYDIGLLPSGFSISPKRYDAVQLRRDLLFWDYLVAPQNSVASMSPHPDIDFLVGEGLVYTPRVPLPESELGWLDSGHLMSSSLGTHSKLFQFLDRRDAGRWSSAMPTWALAQGGLAVDKGRGVFIKLINAIPIPGGDVPLDDVLRFKEVRRSEILRLRFELQGMYNAILSSSDSEFDLVVQLKKVEESCSEVMAVSREAFPFTPGSLALGYSFSVPNAGSGFLYATALSELSPAWLSAPAAMAGFAAGFVQVSQGDGLRGIHGVNPYSVVGDMNSLLRSPVADK